MSRTTLQLLADPELQAISKTAYEEALVAARNGGPRITLDDMVARIEGLLDWRSRALKAEKKLRQKTQASKLETK